MCDVAIVPSGCLLCGDIRRLCRCCFAMHAAVVMLPKAYTVPSPSPESLEKIAQAFEAKQTRSQAALNSGSGAPESDQDRESRLIYGKRKRQPRTWGTDVITYQEEEKGRGLIPFLKSDKLLPPLVCPKHHSVHQYSLILYVTPVLWQQLRTYDLASPGLPEYDWESQPHDILWPLLGVYLTLPMSEDLASL